MWKVGKGGSKNAWVKKKFGLGGIYTLDPPAVIGNVCLAISLEMVHLGGRLSMGARHLPSSKTYVSGFILVVTCKPDVVGMTQYQEHNKGMWANLSYLTNIILWWKLNLDVWFRNKHLGSVGWLGWCKHMDLSIWRWLQVI